MLPINRDNRTVHGKFNHSSKTKHRFPTIKPDRHGKSTSNGEAYDMYAMTAAHKTLNMLAVIKRAPITLRIIR